MSKKGGAAGASVQPRGVRAGERKESWLNVFDTPTAHGLIHHYTRCLPGPQVFLYLFLSSAASAISAESLTWIREYPGAAARIGPISRLPFRLPSTLTWASSLMRNESSPVPIENAAHVCLWPVANDLASLHSTIFPHRNKTSSRQPALLHIGSLRMAAVSEPRSPLVRLSFLHRTSLRPVKQHSDAHGVHVVFEACHRDRHGFLSGARTWGRRLSVDESPPDPPRASSWRTAGPLFSMALRR